MNDFTTEPNIEFMKSFAYTVAAYQEKACESGSLGAMDYGKGVEAGKATNTGSSSTIQPTSADFVCEVDLAAKRVLTVGHFAYFRTYYKTAKVVVSSPDETDPINGDKCFHDHVMSFPQHLWSAVQSFDDKLRLALGKHFIDIDLYPNSKYMQAKDVRIQRARKHKWSHLY